MPETLTKKTFKKSTEQEKKERYEEIRELHSFYRIKWKKNKDTGADEFGGITVEKVPFLHTLKKLGFAVYRVDIDFMKYVKINENVISEIDKDYIIDSFLNWVMNLPTLEESDQNGGSITITPNLLEKKIIDSLEHLFKTILLNRLRPDKKIEFQTDLRKDKYLFYKNGFITVTKDNIEFSPYSDLRNFVWKDQILSRNFTKSDDKKSVFQQFCEIVSGRENPDLRQKWQQRFQALKSIIGYNLHNYTKGKMYATVLTDANMGEDGEANGRSGKTLFAQCLGRILNTNEDATVFVEINGRDFDPKDPHKYSQVRLDTKMVHLNDLKNYFNIEHLFNDITEGLKVKQLYQQPYKLAVKMMISTNKTIKIHGSSARDRVIQFEFDSFFNDQNSPDQYFGHWFFEQWDEAEWARYDNFVVDCIQSYLQNGLIRAEEINLHSREIIDHTSRDFVNWLEYKMQDVDVDGLPVEDPIQFTIKDDVLNEKWYDKKNLYNSFTEMYPDYLNNKRFQQRIFTRWLKFYFSHQYSNILVDEKRSSGTDYIRFLKVEE